MTITFTSLLNTMLSEVPVLQTETASTALFTWLERYYDDDSCVFLTCLADAVETVAHQQGVTKAEMYRLADLDVGLVRQEFEDRMQENFADADDLKYTDNDKRLVAEYLRINAL